MYAVRNFECDRINTDLLIVARTGKVCHLKVKPRVLVNHTSHHCANTPKRENVVVPRRFRTVKECCCSTVFLHTDAVSDFFNKLRVRAKQLQPTLECDHFGKTEVAASLRRLLWRLLLL
jgi:hypothetical protein